MSAGYQLVGMTASPYSMKVRALMRYRRIPFEWIVDLPQLSGRDVKVSPILLPILRHPMGRDLTDSTHIGLVLEREIVNDRQALPLGDTAFLCHLIEDLADEWLTKAMFWLRWGTAAGGDYATGWLTSDVAAQLPRAMRNNLGASLRKRQEGRMGMVGAVAQNAGVIEGGYNAVLRAVDAGVAHQPYLFGTRPSLADFALFGQLSQLSEDPVPGAMMRRDAPAVQHWLRGVDDASGVRGAWGDYSPAVMALLRLAAVDYLPFLAANARALADDAGEFEVTLGSGTYRQTPFRWQAKCLTRLRSLFDEAQLGDETLTLLDETGCLVHLRGG